MNPINTNLTTSGNSVAIRLPKALLKMSGLAGKVKLEAKKGKIIISRADNVRAGWGDQIKALSMSMGDPTREFDDMTAADSDGLVTLAWDGPTFEYWQKNDDQLS